MSSTTTAAPVSSDISYLTQKQAQAIDEDLMGPLGFSIDQLMELAGLSVASAILEVYPPKTHSKVLIICGPGNNGGDGLVAARHLHHFAYKPMVCYPKRTDKALYHGLVKQLENLHIPFLPAEELPRPLHEHHDVAVDAMFGFSFHGIPRPPFDSILRQLVGEQEKLPIVAVDIPSGWHVDKGDVDETGLRPSMLVSLTAPKLAARFFTGPHHFVGGRFVPPEIESKYSLRIPSYQGSAMCVRIGETLAGPIDVAAMRISYGGRQLLEDDCDPDPIKQFARWFEEAVAEQVPEPNAMCLASVDLNGAPSARIVLLKGFDDRGFVWYTNYGSRKGRELLSRDPSRAAIVFFWNEQHRQVRIEGEVRKVSAEESDAYFYSRPWGSQLGAIASPQSTVIEGRHVLDDRHRHLAEKHAAGETIPRPDTWGGFRLKPEKIEFWQGCQSRLHDRILYELDEGGQTWKRCRLAP